MKQTLREAVEIKLKETGLCILIDWNSVSKKGRATYCNITCTKCNTVSNRQIDNLRRGKFNCTGCTDHKFKDRAELLGFDLISVNRSGKTLVNLSCQKDGKNKTVQGDTLMNFKIDCEECRLNFYKKKLSERGCEFISIIKSKNSHNVVFRNSLGKEKSIQSNALHSGEWVAEESRWENPSNLYCFSFTNNGELDNIPLGYYFKIGISRYPSKRLSRLSLKIDADIEILESLPDRFKARASEHLTHVTLNEFKLDKQVAEKFTDGLSNGKIINGIRVKRPEGVTEWFYSQNKIDVKSLLQTKETNV
jgi:hypothetical protein